MRATRGESDEILQSLEGHLQTSLHPVAPNPVFITKLRDRLVMPGPPMLEKESGALGMLLIALGLLTGVAILLLGKRAIVMIAAGIGISISRWKKNNSPVSI